VIVEFSNVARLLFPLPSGEGQGEGRRLFRLRGVGNGMKELFLRGHNLPEISPAACGDKEVWQLWVSSARPDQLIRSADRIKLNPF